jgi:hypothetical protein
MIREYFVQRPSLFWVSYANLIGGNLYTSGVIHPVITPADVQNIIGSTNYNIAPTAND